MTIEKENAARPRGTDSARVMQVIVTECVVGVGLTEDDQVRLVRKFWSFEGELLAINDPVDSRFRQHLR